MLCKRFELFSLFVFHKRGRGREDEDGWREERDFPLLILECLIILIKKEVNCNY